MLSNVDVPEREWKKSEYKHLKFSRSKSTRVTSVIHIDENVQKSKFKSNRRSDDIKFHMNLVSSKFE